MAEAALVHRAAFEERLPWLAGLHTPAEDLGYFRDIVFAECAVWGAWEGGKLAGFVAFRDGWIDQLYVAPERQSQGAGSALLDVACQDQSAVRLWTFQRNARARAFYERRGFVAIEETDGARHHEREPDVLYEWRAP